MYFQIAPHRFGPASVGFMAADHMQVQLLNNIADGTEVDSGDAVVLFDPARNPGAFIHDLSTLGNGQIKQSVSISFGYENVPGHQGIFIQQQITSR